MGAAKLKIPLRFDDAVARYERELMRFLLRSTRDREETLDLFQETWLRAYRAYPDLAAEDGLKPLLYRIATNLCRNWARDRARRGRWMAGAADAASGPHHAPRFGGHESLIDLRRAFARLPDMQGRAFAMRKIGGLEYAEIAEALGTTEESARASVYVAAKKLGAAR